jgi:hypothetical protein
MTIGKITSSNQDLVYVEVRPETGEYLETREAGTLASISIAGYFGAAFTAAHWFDRIIVAIADAAGHDLPVRLYDSPEKTTKIHETVFKKVGESRALHIIFEPLPPGAYYWEIDTAGRYMRPYVYNGSTFQGSYFNGYNDPSKDVRSKIMYCTDELMQVPVAIEGDPIDDGVTNVANGSSIMGINTGYVEKNIAAELDALANGGRILTGSWYLEA